MAPFLWPLVIVLASSVLLWVVSLRLRDASIVDIFWGAAFVMAGWTAHAVADVESARTWLVCAMVTVWGVRLSAHLARRNLGHGEDYRYREMRRRYGDAFPLVSLFIVFLLQGALVWVIAWPVLFAHLNEAAAMPLGWLDVAALGVWGTGLAFEWIADVQLRRFKRQPSSRGAVMDRGLWRYSRHPNYFGNFLLWWGIGLTAVGAGGWWTLAGPLVLTFLLLRVSGVALLESTIAERRPGYRRYVETTSAFVPWFPKGEAAPRT